MKTSRRLDRVGGDQAALDQAVRDARHHLAVLEAPGLGLVGVDDEVLAASALAPVDQRRLAAGREAGAAAAAQLRGVELVDQRRRASSRAPSRAPRSRRPPGSRRARRGRARRRRRADRLRVGHGAPSRSPARPSGVDVAGGSGGRPRRPSRSRSRRGTRPSAASPCRRRVVSPARHAERPARTPRRPAGRRRARRRGSCRPRRGARPTGSRWNMS